MHSKNHRRAKQILADIPSPANRGQVFRARAGTPHSFIGHPEAQQSPLFKPR